MLKLKTIYAEKYSELTEMERQLFRYILSDAKSVLNMSIEELSRKTNTSTSSISRFTQKIGFSGYREFKYFLSQEQTEEKVLSPDLSGEFLLEDLKRTKRLFQQTEWDKVIDWLGQAGMVYCYGTGIGQRIVVEDFARKMLFCGRYVVHVEAGRELDFALDNVRENDVLMIFSLSGNVEKILPQIEMFKEKGGKIVGLCQLGDSLLCELADFTFFFQTQTLGFSRSELVSLLPLNYLTELLQFAYREKFVETKSEVPYAKN